MTELTEHNLKELFAGARQELEGDAITGQILARTRRRSFVRYATALLAALVIILVTWMYFAMPLLEFAVLVSRALTVTLFNLGDGWLALALMPVNNLASLLVLTIKGLHTLRKRVLARAFRS